MEWNTKVPKFDNKNLKISFLSNRAHKENYSCSKTLLVLFRVEFSIEVDFCEAIYINKKKCWIDINKNEVYNVIGWVDPDINKIKDVKKWLKYESPNLNLKTIEEVKFEKISKVKEVSKEVESEKITKDKLFVESVNYSYI